MNSVYKFPPSSSNFAQICVILIFNNPSPPSFPTLRNPNLKMKKNGSKNIIWKLQKGLKNRFLHHLLKTSASAESFRGFVKEKCWSAELQLSSKLSAEVFDAGAEPLLSWTSANHSAGSASMLQHLQQITQQAQHPCFSTFSKSLGRLSLHTSATQQMLLSWVFRLN